MMLALRSFLFLIWGAVVSIVMNVGFVPVLLLPRSATVLLARVWAWLLLFGLKWICGLRLEVRGRLLNPRVIIAAKHYSMWETVALMALLPDPAIILKRSLFGIPFYGWYGRKMEMIPIDRGGHASALRAMQMSAKRVLDRNRPVVIFPEGTRKQPGDPPDYKPGVAGLYTLLGAPCVPIAHNSGQFCRGLFAWKPGTIVVEYLESIPPGVPRREFMAILQTRIEEATARLLTEHTA